MAPSLQEQANCGHRYILPGTASTILSNNWDTCIPRFLFPIGTSRCIPLTSPTPPAFLPLPDALSLPLPSSSYFTFDVIPTSILLPSARHYSPPVPHLPPSVVTCSPGASVSVILPPLRPPSYTSYVGSVYMNPPVHPIIPVSAAVPVRCLPFFASPPIGSTYPAPLPCALLLTATNVVYKGNDADA